MNTSERESGDRYDAMVAELVGLPGVTQSMKRGFGQYGLKVDGKLFASLLRSGGLILKLPKPRIDWLSDAGDGIRFDPVHGRPMKEWIVVSRDSAVDWLDLAREALAFVRQVGKSS
jgi:hypothetical protein